MNVYQDAHNHLQHAALHPHLAEILSTVRELPVTWMVVNGTAESDWEKVAKMAKELSFVIPSFGLHPWFLLERSKDWEEGLRIYLTQTSCAVGDKFLPFGSYFSFSGYFLNRGKEQKAQTFREVPYDRLLVETDAPDMPLPAERNQFPLPNAAEFECPNHPANIRAVVRGLAEILNKPEDEVLQTVGHNFRRLFQSVIPGERSDLAVELSGTTAGSDPAPVSAE